MTEVATTFVGRKRPKMRLPAPYIIEHEHERFDFGCASCRVVIAGLRCEKGTAVRWADEHRCTESWTDQRRPWP